MATDLQIKLQRVRDFLARRRLAAVVLNAQNNLTWITDGGEAHVVIASEGSVASIVVTRKNQYLLTNRIERGRLIDEELPGNTFEVLEYEWADSEAPLKLIADMAGKGQVVSDNGIFGLPLAGGDLARLRWDLTPGELKKYRHCGKVAGQVLEKVVASIRPGDNEIEIGGRLIYEGTKSGLTPILALLASDERIVKYRHPIPVDKKVKKHVMVVLCARYHGLISNLTRFVYFGKLPKDLRERQQAVTYVDTAFNLATRPGEKVSEVFRKGLEAYDQMGFREEWKLHHQGGLTGYAGREYFGTPNSKEIVQANQAFAWNPSITGTKSEDTILVTPRGNEVITGTGKWPQIKVEIDGKVMLRPDILVK